MYISYMFLKKSEKDNTVCFEDFLKMLNRVFVKITHEVIVLKINSRSYFINYKCTTSKDNKIIYLNISYKGECEKTAKILNNANDVLLKGEHRKDYNIYPVYDGVSQYYCNKAYRYISKFERKLRELLYVILIKELGNDWYKKTLSKETINHLKSKKIHLNQIIEDGLSELTLFELETILFEPVYGVDVIDIFDNQLSAENLEEKNKEEVIKIIEEVKPKSLWRRYFTNKLIDKNFEIKLEEVRLYRNIIAHSKALSRDDFNKFYTSIINLIKEIEKNIENINDIYTRDKFLHSTITYISKILFMPKTISTIKDLTVSTAVSRLGELKFDFSDKLLGFSKISSIKPLGIASDIKRFQSTYGETFKALGKLTSVVPKLEITNIQAQLAQYEIATSRLKLLLEHCNSNNSELNTKLSPINKSGEDNKGDNK